MPQPPDAAEQSRVGVGDVRMYNAVICFRSCHVPALFALSCSGDTMDCVEPCPPRASVSVGNPVNSYNLQHPTPLYLRKRQRRGKQNPIRLRLLTLLRRAPSSRVCRCLGVKASRVFCFKRRPQYGFTKGFKDLGGSGFKDLIFGIQASRVSGFRLWVQG